MKDQDGLTRIFEENRGRLEAVAYRILGSKAEADDAVQEAWIKIAKSETSAIENWGGWLTTVVVRICLDILRSRKVRSASQLKESLVESKSESTPDAERDLLIGDSMGPALLFVLETLSPPERVAFVLHDIFDLAFEEIASILERSEVSVRQLASRARRKVRGPKEISNNENSRAVVEAFLAASREGNFEALLKLLDPGIVLRADETAVVMSHANKSRGAPQFEKRVQGSKAVADIFKGKAAAAAMAWVDGVPGATWIAGGKPRVAFTFKVKDGLISEIDVIMSPADLSEMDVLLPEKGGRP